jgi:peroxiredoxin
MKTAMLKTFHMLYPEQDWLHIYTATFLIDKKGNVEQEFTANCSASV